MKEKSGSYLFKYLLIRLFATGMTLQQVAILATKSVRLAGGHKWNSVVAHKTESVSHPNLRESSAKCFLKKKNIVHSKVNNIAVHQYIQSFWAWRVKTRNNYQSPDSGRVKTSIHWLQRKSIISTNNSHSTIINSHFISSSRRSGCQ